MIRIVRLWRKTQQRFRIDERGAILMIIAFALIPLIGAVGVGVDTARGYLVKEKLQRAVDIAGLAGARKLESPDLATEVQEYFNANFPADFMNVATVTPTYTVSEDNTKITITATASVKTSFMSVLGFTTLDVTAETEVVKDAGFLDLVLAVDMSGSMGNSEGGQTRIAAARTAAITLVNDLFGSDETKATIGVGLVPWNDKVNITLDGSTFNFGATTTTAVTSFTNPITNAPQSVVYNANNTPVPLLFAPPNGWIGCVFARHLDDGNNSNDGDVFEVPDTFGNKDWPAWEPPCATVGGGSSDDDDDDGSASCGAPEGGSSDDDDDDGGAGASNEGNCLTHGITPLQNSKTPIINALNALTSPRGNTNIPQGLAWAWRVLTAATPFTEADPDPSYPVTRAIVILTDGDNVAGSTDAYKGNLNNGEIDDRLRTLATNIKAAGIKIITIQYANSSGPTTSLLQEIATSASAPYYNYAPDAATLTQIFQDVANELSSLRIAR